MKITFPKKYRDYQNCKVYIIRKSSNSFFILNEEDKEVFDKNINNRKDGLTRFLISNVTTCEVINGTTEIDQITFTEYLLSKQNLGILISSKKSTPLM